MSKFLLKFAFAKKSTFDIINYGNFSFEKNK